MIPNTRIYQCVLVGAGAAAISARLWLHSLDLHDIQWIAKGPLGGMLHNVHNAIHNYPGLPTDNGQQLARHLAEQLPVDDLSPPLADTLLHIHAPEDPIAPLRLRTEHQDELLTHCLILATGTHYRRLNLEHEREGLGSYISQSAVLDGPRLAGQHVAVVGGGDSAFEGALRLAEHDCQVHLLMRSRAKARLAFQQRVHDNPLITIAPKPTTVTAIKPLPDHNGCQLQLDSPDHYPDSLQVAALIVRVGVEANIPPCDPPFPRGKLGIHTDHRQATHHPRIFAAGDVTNQILRAVSVATGQGARAALSVVEHFDEALQHHHDLT